MCAFFLCLLTYKTLQNILTVFMTNLRFVIMPQSCIAYDTGFQIIKCDGAISQIKMNFKQLHINLKN